MSKKNKENLETKKPLKIFRESEASKTDWGITIHLNEKDKIRALSLLKGELNEANLTNLKLSPELVANELKTACRSIEDAIEEAIEFAILKHEIVLKNSRKNLLIGQAKLLNELKVVYEKKLIDIGFTRNEKEETQFKEDFDFELDPPQVKTYLEDASIIKKEIKTAIQGVDDKKKKTKKDEMPFIIGLLFAQGIPQELYKKYENKSGCYLLITKELGYKESQRTYFSSTFSRIKNSLKNIYSRLDLMQRIKQHCIENNITTCEDFKIQLTELQSKNN